MARSSPGRYATHEFGKNVYLFEARGAGDAALPIEQVAPAHWRITPDRQHRPRPLPAVCRPRRRHVLGRRRHARAPERAGDLRLGAVADRDADPRSLHAAARTHLARLHAAVPDRRSADVHGAEPAVLHGLAGRVQRARGARVHRRAGRWRRAGAHPAGRAPPRHRRAARRVRRDGREDRPRTGRGLRRAGAVRRRHVHVPDGLPAVGRRRRHGAPQQHGLHRRRRRWPTAWRAWPARRRTSSSTPGTSSGSVRPRSSRSTSRRPNMSGELWLAEGFTSYYGVLAMIRAGLIAPGPGRGAAGDVRRRRAARARHAVPIGGGHEPAGAVRRCRRRRSTRPTGRTRSCPITRMARRSGSGST